MTFSITSPCLYSDRHGLLSVVLLSVVLLSVVLLSVVLLSVVLLNVAMLSDVPLCAYCHINLFCMLFTY